MAEVDADGLRRTAVAVAPAAVDPLPLFVFWAALGCWLLVYAAERLVGGAAL